MNFLRRGLSTLWKLLNSPFVNTQRSAYFLLLIGFGAAIIGYLQQYVYSDWFNFLDNPIADFYANTSSELVSIAITVLIIERANRKENERERKQELILQMGSPNNSVAIEAVRLLQQRGWLTDNLLKTAKLRRANLQDADLKDANLHGADLWRANLQSAYLYKVNLEGANLGEVNLQGANMRACNLQDAVLWNADLRHADLMSANLLSSDLWQANLAGCNLKEANFEEAILPDGTIWTEETDIERFTNPEHPNFWKRSEQLTADAENESEADTPQSQ